MTKSELVNFLLEHKELQWEMDGKTEEILLKAIDEFFEKYEEKNNPFNLDKKIEEAVRDTAANHRKIINDWCKAYVAQTYEETGSIKPGDFTLNEQWWEENGKMGKRYWFTPGVPDY